MGTTCGCDSKGRKRDREKLRVQVISGANTQTADPTGPVHLRSSLQPTDRAPSHRGPTSSARADRANFEFEFPKNYRSAAEDRELDSFVQSMSFIKENNVNNLSFDLYGEDLSKVRQTYLQDLKANKDLSVKVTRQELLLLSADVPELLAFLKKSNFDLKSLSPYPTATLNELMNVSSLKRKIAARDQLRFGEPVYPEDLRLKYLKMVECGPNGRAPRREGEVEESRFLNTTYEAGEYLEKESQDLLLRSSVINKAGLIAPPWDSDRFELCVDTENRSKNDIAEFDAVLLNLAAELKVPHSPQGLTPGPANQLARGVSNVGTANLSRPSGVFAQNGGALPEVMGELKPICDDLRFASFQDKSYFAVMASVINYDQVFETNLIKRLIFPQKEGRAYPTQSGIHIVKLYVNGAKRAFVCQSLDVHRHLTTRNEQYPLVLQTALQLLYPDLSKVCPTVLLFRLCNWIPEKMFVKDVGDVFTSFDKLRETFKAGNLILQWEELATGRVRPVLDFVTPEKSFKRYIKTTSEAHNAEQATFYLADWEELYNGEKIGNLFINWNPTIYLHRKTMHALYFGNQPYRGGFDTPNFKLQRAPQFLFTLHPHKDVCETRIVIEKHRSLLNIPYKIKYSLYSFSKSRVVLPNGPLREVEVRESEEELLSDILIFDENPNFENYVVVVQLTVENEADLALIREDHFEIVTLSLYTFAEFDLIEMPYPVVEQLVTSTPSVALAPAPTALKPSSPDQPDLSQTPNAPFYKLQIYQRDTYEIRVDTDAGVMAEIVIMNYENMRRSLSRVQAPLHRSENVAGSNSLVATLEPGIYAAKVTFSQSGEAVRNLIRHSVKTERFASDLKRANSTRPGAPEQITVLFLAFASKFAKNYEPRVKPPGSGFDGQAQSSQGGAPVKMKVEQITLQNQLPFKRVLKGSWSKQTNFGSAKAKIACYQKFMKNPGFVLQPSADSEFRFRLSTQRSSNVSAFPYICVAVFEIKDDFTFSTVLEDEDYIQASEFTTDVVMLRPNRFGYLVVCLTLEPTFQAPFELEVSSERELKSFYDTRSGILQFPFKKEVVGEIRAMTGGHIVKPSFLFNSAFLLTFEEVRKDGLFFAELTTGPTTQNISLYLIPTAKQSLVELAEMDINNFDYNAAFLNQVNAVFRPITAQRFLVVPSTLNVLTDALPFELKFQSTCRFEVAKVPQVTFNDSYVITQDDRFGRETKFVLKQPDRVLVVVQPNTPAVKVQLAVIDLTLGKEIYQSFSEVQEGFVFKTLDLQEAGHQYLLQVITGRGVVSTIKIYGSKLGNLHII